MAALEQLSLSSGRLSPTQADADAVTNGRQQQQQQQVDTGDEGGKAPRLPRWTRQEILVLIQGKREAESRVRRGRAAGLGYGLSPAEPKWASVSSYCKRHGVNRGPVQCRKRWSNLAGDFKKIKEHESRIRDESESFWVMRNDIRRDKKLPGFFDKEVYDILYAASTSGASAAAQAVDAAEVGEDEKEGEGLVAGDEAEAEAEAETETLFDSGKSATADDGLFSDFEQSGQDDVGMGQSPAEKVGLLQTPEKEVPMAFPAPTPISEKQYEPLTGGMMGQGTGNRQTGSNPEIGSTSQEGRKRKRSATEGDPETTCSIQEQLLQVLERNGRVLSAQLEAQNTNLRLDREERKEHAVGLVAVLNKLADAMSRIADKI